MIYFHCFFLSGGGFRTRGTRVQGVRAAAIVKEQILGEIDMYDLTKRELIGYVLAELSKAGEYGLSADELNSLAPRRIWGPMVEEGYIEPELDCYYLPGSGPYGMALEADQDLRMGVKQEIEQLLGLVGEATVDDLDRWTPDELKRFWFEPPSRSIVRRVLDDMLRYELVSLVGDEGYSLP